MPCFKLPRFKWIKKKNKRNVQHIQPVSDVTTIVMLDEFRQQREPTSSSALNQDNSSNHSSTSNSSVNAKTEYSQKNENEKSKYDDSKQSFENDESMNTTLKNSHVTQKNNDKDDDFDVKSQNSENSTDGKEVSMREEYYLKLLETLNTEINESSNGKTDSNVAPEITTDYPNIKGVLEPNEVLTNCTTTIARVAEVLEPNEILTNCTTTIARVAEVSDIDEILERIYIKKSFQIINKITIYSNVFEEIEKLKAFEMAGKKLHPDLLQEDTEIYIKDTQCGIGDFHKSFKIDTKISTPSTHNEIPQDVELTDNLSVESERIQNLLVNDEIAIDKLGYKHDAYVSSDISLVPSVEEKENVIQDVLVASMKNKNTISKNGKYDDDVDTENENHNSDKYSEVESEISEVNSEDESICDVGLTAEVSLEINENVLPAEKNLTEIPLENNEDKREDDNQIKVKTLHLDEIIQNTDVICTNTGVEEKMNSINVRKKTHDKKENLVSITSDYVNTVGTQTSTENITTAVNSQFKCKNDVSDKEVNLDSVIKMDEFKILPSINLKQQTDFPQCQSSESLKIFHSGIDGKDNSDEGIGKDFFLDEAPVYKYLPNVESDELLSNQGTENLAQIDSLKYCSNSSEAQSISSEANNCIIKNTSNKFNYSCENLTHGALEDIITMNDSLHIHDRGDANRKIRENFDLKSEKNKAVGDLNSAIDDLKNFETISHNFQNNICMFRKQSEFSVSENKTFEENPVEDNDFLDQECNVSCQSQFNKSPMYLDDSNYSDEFSDHINSTSKDKSEMYLNSFTKFVASNSITDKQRKYPQLNEQINKMINDLAESLFVNSECNSDDNIFNEESLDEKYKAENSISFQYKDIISTHSSQEEMRCPKEFSGFQYFNNSYQQTCDVRSKSKNLKESNSFRHEFHYDSETEEKIAASKGQTRGFPRQITKISKEEIQGEEYNRKLTDKEILSKIPEDSLLIKEIDNKPSPNEFRNHNTLVISGNNRIKSVSKYSLSDSSYSSESSKLSECGYLKAHEFSAEDAGNLVISGSGDSGAEEKCFDDDDILCKLKNTLQNFQEYDKLQHTYMKSKKRPKTRKGQKIEICFTKNSSQKDKTKVEKNIHSNKKHTSTPNKNIVKLDSGDHAKLLSYLNKSSKEYKLKRTNKNKQNKMSKGKIHGGDTTEDEIEIKRTESINLFNKRKQNILSEMGPNLRIIKIKKVESSKFDISNIEKIFSKIDITPPRKRNNFLKHSPDVHTFARIKNDKARDTHEKSSLMKNKISEQADSGKSNLSSRKSKDTDECDMIQGDYFINKNKTLEKTDFVCESDRENLTEGSEKMTPTRRAILDSSRSIRSPKYFFPLSSKIAHKQGIFAFKPVFIKSSRQKIVAHLKDNEMNVFKCEDGRNVNSPDIPKFKIGSPRKKLTDNGDDCNRQQHTNSYRTTTPDDLRVKFDDVFKRYAGKGRYNGDLISYKRSTEWLRDAGVIGNVLSAEEATDAFKCAAGVKVALNKGDYRLFLQKLTRVKRLNYFDVYDKLCKASSRCIEA